MANDTRVTGAQLASMVREEDLVELEGVLKELEDSAHKAKDDGRIYMAQQYIGLISNVNAEVHRIRVRFKREAIASLRRETKTKKDELSEKQESA